MSETMPSNSESTSVDHLELTVRTADTGEAIAQFLVGTKGQKGTPDDRKAIAGTFVQTMPEQIEPSLHGRSIDLSDIGNVTQSFEKPDDLDRLQERAVAELRAAYPETDVVVERVAS